MKPSELVFWGWMGGAMTGLGLGMLSRGVDLGIETINDVILSGYMLVGSGIVLSLIAFHLFAKEK